MAERGSRDVESQEERPGEVVTRFLSAFYAGSVEDARAMVTDDFVFQAPLADDGTKDVYFAGAERKAALIRDFRVVRQWEAGPDVSTLYEIDVETSAGSASMRMYEWHHVRDGSIDSAVMVFDTVAPAADLIRGALGH